MSDPREILRRANVRDHHDCFQGWKLVGDVLQLLQRVESLAVVVAAIGCDQQFGRDFWLAKSDTLGPLGPLELGGEARGGTLFKGKRVFQGSDSFIVSDIDRFIWFSILLPIVPCAHQHVLQQRKLVLILSEIIEQA